MRTPHVLVGHDLEDLGPGATLPLDPDRLHHLRRVLRRADGSPLQVTDGRGRVAAAVLVGEEARLESVPVVRPAPRPAVVVHHAVPKGRALDEVVRTLAELGVAEVRPVLTERTESRPSGGKARSVGDRLRAVAESALQQAQSAHLCRVGDPAPLAVTQRDHPPDALLLAAHPGAAATLGADLATVSPDREIHLLVGPEGGISDRELGELEAAGWTPVRAGRTVLRTVHAATVLTSAVLALTGRFGEAGP